MELSAVLALKKEIEECRSPHTDSLWNYFIDDALAGVGFRHTYNPHSDPSSTKASSASTATCVVSLIDAGEWSGKTWSTKTGSIVGALTKEQDPSKWNSADLGEGNPFTVGFKTEALQYLLQFLNQEKEQVLYQQVQEILKRAEKILVSSLSTKAPAVLDATNADKFAAEGSAHIQYYPPTAFLTHLVVRALNKLNPDCLAKNELLPKIKSWAWRQLEHELAIVFGHKSGADAYSLIYSALIFVECTKKSDITPVENQLVAKAISVFFDMQLEDGSWPLSRPLHHYPKFGNAYCYEYECLTQVLGSETFQLQLEPHLDKLARATKRLKLIAVPLDKGFGWASAHHPTLTGAESWSTASVYHFLYKFDRLLAEIIRKRVFEYVGEQYSIQPPCEKFAEKFLDCPVKLDKGAESLTTCLEKHLLLPIKERLDDLKRGKQLPKEVSISAIFYGPPGTSKTELATHISEYLGWPLLKLDPSHLVREGLDQIQAETNKLFEMLCATERTVVLLDEFDEMVRDRSTPASESSSRFLTTAMLPKLASINRWRRLVFILATNFIEDFDIAIRRRGRFDLVLQVLPPTYNAKIDKWEILKSIKTPDEPKPSIEEMIGDLTFAECAELAKKIKDGNGDGYAQLKSQYERCTLRTNYLQTKPTNDAAAQKWSDVCSSQQALIRIPG